MQALSALFPSHDFSLIAVILGLPALGAFVNGVFGKRLGKEGVRLMALAAVGGSFLAAVVAFFMLRGSASAGVDEFTWNAWHWLDLSTRNGMGRTPVSVSFMLDRLNSVMMLVITGVGFLIHLYASSYMWDDTRIDGGFHRFFAYLNLFVFSMLLLVLGSNLPILFVGWEGVGVCSYLLIGFWYSSDANASAGKKAFIANRIGDFGLLVAMALLVVYTGALDWKGIGMGAGGLLEPVQVWPLGRGIQASFLPESLLGWLNTPVTFTAATLVALMLFLGAAGKSAQIPLYVWLPDAMAGPTPVSALIHAATMVTAGIYLICRMSGVFLLAPGVMAIIAVIGALTALLAASIGLVQNDIKKVLAYSTVSQLGYMFLGVGVGAFTAGFFHVFTHAFFKACLFLGAGSVIHAMHAGIHDSDTAQDMRNMGGMRKWMPITHVTFLVSCLAIAGIFPFAGFFSKDEILLHAFGNHIVGISDKVWTAPTWFGPMLYVAGLAGATMTAFYMFRAYFLTFWGDFRGWKVSAVSGPPPADVPHDPNREAPAPQESPWQMTIPLVVLGALAVLSGFFNATMLKMTFLADWLAPIFRGTEQFVRVREGIDLHSLEILFGIIGVLIGGLGIGLAYFIYMMKNGEPARVLAERFPALYRLLSDKWRVDELYEATVIAQVDALADSADKVDKWVVDGILAKLSSVVVAASGVVLRAAHTGMVHAYAFVMVIGLGGLGWFFTKPHTTAQIRDTGSQMVTIEAASGLGYEYKWHSEGSDQPEADEWTKSRSLEISAPPAGETKRVRLQVRNAFQRTAETVIEIPSASSNLGKQSFIQGGNLR